MDDFSKYQSLSNDGKGASEVCATAKTDGLDWKTTIRMLQQVFGLSELEAYAVMDDYSKYQVLRNEGGNALEVCATAKRDGLDWTALIRMLRRVFGLSLAEAKAIWFEVDTGKSLYDHQGELAKLLPEILDSLEGFDRGDRHTESDTGRTDRRTK